MRARFAPGEAVRVARRWPRGHVRTPTYLRGREGRVERVLGPFPNPEDLAYGGDGLPAPVLYRVRFEQARLWPGYRGGAGDTLDAEIYEHWLEPAGETPVPQGD